MKFERSNSVTQIQYMKVNGYYNDHIEEECNSCSDKNMKATRKKIASTPRQASLKFR